MSKKHHGPAPVPPGNRPPSGPPIAPDSTENDPSVPLNPDEGAPFQEQDVKRRLGNYGGAGEHPIQQPGRSNDGDFRGG